ncbi:hypothetical protein [Kribbella sp. NBC_00889]|uniref:hypothetical protein n=1 Tax=Kribbella sp. NBC_00889 TaxID=2975974 RepID=UPI00386A1AEA|nr:hypothetical protein OG817_22190 [Kribbella sp. NBC_00889]
MSTPPPATETQRAMIAELRRTVVEAAAAVAAADSALADPELDRDQAREVIATLRAALPKVVDSGVGFWFPPKPPAE